MGADAYWTVHPRACGEHCQFHLLHPHGRGSSPRLRGTRRGAAAGRRTRPVHPRACGEHAKRWRGYRNIAGSSPRLRGTHFLYFVDLTGEISQPKFYRPNSVGPSSSLQHLLLPRRVSALLTKERHHRPQPRELEQEGPFRRRAVQLPVLERRADGLRWSGPAACRAGPAGPRPVQQLPRRPGTAQRQAVEAAHGEDAEWIEACPRPGFSAMMLAPG
jgi:hypothetical protein